MKKRSLHTLIIIFASTNSYAQLSIDEYRSEVLDYSLELKKSENTASKSYDEVVKYKTLRLPTLSVSGSFDYNMRQISGQKEWSFYLQPQLTQTLYGGGAIGAEIDSYKLKHDIALCDMSFTRLEVIYAAEYAYWNLVATHRYRNAMLEYVKIIKSLKEVIDRRFSEGYISKGDVLMMATRLSEAEYSLVSAEQSYTVALHNFNILRGELAERVVELIRIDASAVLIPRRVSLSEILERRPDYAAIELNEMVSEVAIRSTKATYNPTLKASIGMNWSPYTPNFNGKTRVDGSAFLQLSATIFHFGERRKSINVARATLLESEINEAILHDSIEAEETNGWTTVVDTHAQLHSATKSLDIAGENLEISTYSYSEGQATILDVMQAQISWIQIYTNAINAEFNYLVAVSSYSKIVAENDV